MEISKNYEHPCKLEKLKQKRLNEKRIFDLIDAEMARITTTDDFARTLTAVFSSRLKQRNAGNQMDLLQIANRLMELNRKKNRLFELYVEEKIEKTDISNRIAELERQMNQLRKQEKALAVDQKSFVFRVSEVIEDFKNFPKIYAASTDENKAALLRRSIDQITLSDTRAALVFKGAFRILYKPELLALAKSVQVHNDMWAHQDLNLGPTDYESAALTN
jgi:hypothetical protein